MTRFHFLAFLVILIITPQLIDSFLLQSAENIIRSAGRLQCPGDNGESASDCNLCAMRVYTYTTNASDEILNVTTQNCVRFTNTFRQYIEARNCTDFTANNDIGFGTCDPMPYENVDNITLCICSSNNCTEDLSTCIQSVQAAGRPILLPNIMSNLTVIIKCADASYQYLCSQLPAYLFTDDTSCPEYSQNNNVLCVISNTGSSDSLQLGMTYENYQIYVTDALYTLTSIIADSTIRSSNTTIYAIYPSSTETDNRQCGCAYNSFCNADMATCASSLIEIETNDTSELSTDTSATVTFEYTSASGLSDSMITSSSTDTAASSTVSTNVGSTATDSITFESSSSANTITSAVSSISLTDNTAVSTTQSSFSSTSDATSAATFSTSAGITTTDLITSSSSSSTSAVTSATTFSTTVGNITIDSTTSSISSTTNNTSSASSTSSGTTTTTVSATSSSNSSSTSGVTSSASLTTTSISGINSSSTSATRTTARMNNTTVANSPSNSTGLSRGAVAGIVVGSVLGGVILISAGIFACIGSGKLSLPFDRAGGYRI